MQNIGAAMVVAGLFAIVLDVVNRVPSYLIWIYNWGDGVAWLIKIGLVVVGGLIYYMFRPKHDDGASG